MATSSAYLTENLKTTAESAASLQTGPKKALAEQWPLYITGFPRDDMCGPEDKKTVTDLRYTDRAPTRAFFSRQQSELIRRLANGADIKGDLLLGCFQVLPVVQNALLTGGFQKRIYYREPIIRLALFSFTS